MSLHLFDLHFHVNYIFFFCKFFLSNNKQRVLRQALIVYINY